MLYTLRGIRRGFWTAFPANQLVLPVPADLITTGVVYPATEDDTDEVFLHSLQSQGKTTSEGVIRPRKMKGATTSPKSKLKTKKNSVKP